LESKLKFQIEVFDEFCAPDDPADETLEVETLAIASNIATSRLMFNEISSVKITKVEV